MFNEDRGDWTFGTHRHRRFARPPREDGPHEGGHRGRHHGPHGGGHGRHGKHGLGRFFAHGDLRLVVLNLIKEKPSHGYEIIKAIEERVSGAYSPSPGVIYPTLTLLEELGYAAVSATDESSKKLYAITAEGEAYLLANRKSLEPLLARIEDAGRSHRSSAAPQIVRAMENLKLALRLRMSNGPLSEDEINAVAAAIDTAALTVEKV